MKKFTTFLRLLALIFLVILAIPLCLIATPFLLAFPGPAAIDRWANEA